MRPDSIRESERLHRDVFLYLTRADILSLRLRPGFDLPRIIFELSDSKDSVNRIYVWDGQETRFLADATDQSITDLLAGKEPILPPGGSNGEFLGHDKLFRRVNWSVITGKPATYPPSPHTHPISQVVNLQNRLDDKIDWTERGSANGVASLGPDSKIPTSELPALAISDVFVVNSEASMLGLNAQTGDVCVRTDLSRTFILSTENPSVLADWIEIQIPPDIVQSVNGQSGNVVLDYADVGADPAGSAAALVFGHEAEIDPHPQYTTESEAANAAPVQSVNGQAGDVVLDFNDVGADPVGAGVGAVANHEADPDPHPQYTTASEAEAAAPVQSVNGQTGNVTLDSVDVNADPAGSAITEVANHEAEADPHPQYTTASEASAAAPVQSVNGEVGDVILSASDVGADPVGSSSAAISNHVAQTDPHTQYILRTERGQPNGVASLNNSGKVPDSELPSVLRQSNFFSNTFETEFTNTTWNDWTTGNTPGLFAVQSAPGVPWETSITPLQIGSKIQFIMNLQVSIRRNRDLNYGGVRIYYRIGNSANLQLLYEPTQDGQGPFDFGLRTDQNDPIELTTLNTRFLQLISTSIDTIYFYIQGRVWTNANGGVMAVNDLWTLPSTSTILIQELIQ